jgi:uncharacterized protein YbcI
MRRCSDTSMGSRRQSKIEAAISDEMMSFQHEFVGRGPDRIRTRIVEDLVIVRSFGVFTPAEKQLIGEMPVLEVTHVELLK